MAIENITVKFEADTSGIKTVIEQVDKLSESTDKTTKSFDNLSKSGKDIAQNLAIGGATEKITDLGNQIDQAANKSKTLIGQLRAMKQELSLMESAGQSGSKAFEQLAIKAAKLEDQVGDTARRIRALASDTFALDATVDAVTGLVGAFTAAQGAAALLGVKNEELQKTLVKVQGSVALLNGLQQIQKTFQKESPALLGAQVVAQKIYNVVVGESIGVTKAFRIALAATGVGLLVIGLIALVENFDKIKDALGIGVNPQLKEAAVNQQKLVDLSAKLADGTSLEERRLKALGATDSEILKVRISNIQKYIEALKIQHDIQQKIVDETAASVSKGAGIAAALSNIIPGVSTITDAIFGSPEELGKSNKALKDTGDAFEEAGVKLLETQKELKDAFTKEGVTASDAFTKLMVKQIEELKTQAALVKEAIAAVGGPNLEAIVDNLQKQLDLEKQIDDANASELESFVNAEIKKQEASDKTTKQYEDDQKKRLLADIQYVQAAGNLVFSLFDFTKSLQNSELTNLDDKRRRGLITEKEYAKKVAEINRKQAIANKEEAAFETILNTAKAIMSILGDASLPAIAKPFLAIAAGVTGAIELAIIASQPIPKIPTFAKGTKKAPPGFKIVGEQGPELIHDKGGYPIIPNGPTMQILEHWMKPAPIDLPSMPVYMSDETMSHMTAAGIGGIDYDKLAKKVGEQIAKHPKLSITMDKDNLVKVVTEAGNKTKSLDDYYSWSG